MQIALGSDHAGFEYKERLKLFLIELGHVVDDFGTESTDAVDYPLIMRPLAMAVADGEFDRGIILGGSGNGEAIVANRISGIRCALCWDLQTAKWSRQHNDANILSLGQRTISYDLAQEIVECWLETEFDGGRHLRRICQIDKHLEGASHRIPLPHRTELVNNASCLCDNCGERFEFPVDISQGRSQNLIEECAVCAYENSISLTIDETGVVTVTEDQLGHP